MILLYTDKIPKSYSEDTPDGLGEYQIKELRELGVEEARYWYVSRPYEGSGQMLLRKGGLWYHHDMGHCSCYGPTERISLGNGYRTLAKLLAACSEELRGYLQPLVDLE